MTVRPGRTARSKGERQQPDDVSGPGEAAIEALVTGRHGDPFSVLGRHGSELRCLAPGAAGVEAISPEGAVLARLECLHAAGFFAGELPGEVRYRLRILWPGAAEETEDPY